MESETKRPWLATFATIGAVVLVCGGGTYLNYAATDRSTPESTVNDFLDAVHDRDVDEALGYVSADSLPTGEAAAFLDPRAMSTDWRVSSVKITDDDGSSADARLSIESHGHTDKATLSLTHDEDGPWRIDDPFAWVELTIPYDVVRVNGYTRPVSGLSQADDGTSIPLFPGSYAFFDDPPRVLAPDGTGDGQEIEIDAEPGAKAERSARRQIEAITRACVKATSPAPAGCPFGVRHDDDIDDDTWIHQPVDTHWTLKRMPTISLAWSETVGAIEIVTGDGEITAKGTDAGNDGAHFTVHCGLDYNAFTATIDANGSVHIRVDHTRTTDTCGREDR